MRQAQVPSRLNNILSPDSPLASLLPFRIVGAAGTELLKRQDFSGLATELVVIGRAFHAREWALATNSNYSVVVSRNPLRLL